MQDHVLTVNLENDLGDDFGHRKEFVKQFGDSIRHFGFVVLEGHGIDDKLIQDSYAALREFFRQDDDFKRLYEDPTGTGQRGYTAFGREHAKDQKIGDLKEFWHVGREVLETSELAKIYPENIWPDERKLPEFRSTLIQLYEQLDRLSQVLLSALSLYLNLPANLLPSMAKDGNSILRGLHYPKVSTEDLKSGAVRAAAHEDINLITILCEATESGLEILTRDRRWVPIVCGPGQFVIDSGDMLSRVTNGIIPATTHRVVNTPESAQGPRYSMPFFVHPYPSCDLTVIDSLTLPGKPPRHPPCTAAEFLNQRLAEIGLKPTQNEDANG